MRMFQRETSHDDQVSILSRSIIQDVNNIPTLKKYLGGPGGLNLVNHGNWFYVDSDRGQ